MHYVYLLRSIPNPEETYIGLTSDLKARLQKHNEGGSPHTAKFRPWQLVHYSAFSFPGKGIRLRILPQIRLRPRFRRK